MFYLQLAAQSILIALAGTVSDVAIAAPVGRCHFDSATLQFQGSAKEQAGCLLRHVAKWGKVNADAPQLSPALADLFGQPTGPLLGQLRKYLSENGVTEASLGGALHQALSHANGGAPSAPLARYFVIHDTSAPWLGDAAFPADDAAALNSLAGYGGPDAVAHVFVNRVGNTLVGHDFAVPWRATKLETKVIGTPAKGLFLHIELLQPRRRDPAGSPKNDAVAPNPGFTQSQYDKLALLYVAASARSGVWLTPALHAAIDEGISDAHDDPQNFELSRFTDAVAALRAKF